jgi:hypothetical protein
MIIIMTTATGTLGEDLLVDKDIIQNKSPNATSEGRFILPISGNVIT